MADNELIKSGTVLFTQGEIPRDLFFLQSGSLEILGAASEFNGLDTGIIISKSRRMGLIRGKSLIVGFSEFFIRPYICSVRAVEDSQVIRYPFGSGGFNGIVASDPPQAVAILKQLYGRFAGFVSELDRYENLRRNISKVNDNFSLIYKELTVKEVIDYLDDRASQIHESYLSNGGVFPPAVGARFLVADNSSLLDKKDDASGKPIDSIINSGLSEFIKKLLKLDPRVLMPLIQSDPSLAMDIFSSVSGNIEKTLNRIIIAQASIDGELDDIFGEKEGWATFLVEHGGYSEWEGSGRVEPDFLKNFLTVIVKINSAYEEIFGKKLTEDFPGVKKIHIYYTSRKSDSVPVSKPTGETGGALDSSQPAAARNMPPEMKRSINQIFEFAMADKDFQNQFIKLLNEFKNMKNPFNTEIDGRKVRRHITKMYWDLYKQVYNRMRAEKSAPLPAKLMIYYGFLDEKLLEDFQVAELTELIKRRDEAKTVPVMYEYEFLSLINAGQEEPSITEMGLNYAAHLREEEKHSKAKDDQGGGVEDENLKMTLFEIEQRLRSTSAVCSGSTATAFPILNSIMIKSSFASMYVSKRRVEKAVIDLMNIDFSVFWRETILKIGEAREIIKEEILPYMILLPITGTRTLLWQELTGVDKRSRGRIMIPVFFAGDLTKYLAHTLACFRWELNRSIKGQAMWADPIEGGITGEYFDYVNTYKKMSGLSVEMKEKIAARFKALRTNRDRFADDYLSWIFYEKDGIMKLNSVVRAIFYKYMPFKKETRDKLESMPAFAQVATRYKNVSLKTHQGYERKFKKYMDENGKYLDGIQQFMEFLKI